MVSVIIPYDKDRGFLDEAILSVHRQTYKDWELILEHSDEFLGANMNRGIVKARGEFIKMLAEDDELTPDCLKILVNGIQGYDFVYSDAENFGDLSPGWPAYSSDKTTTLQEMLKGNCIHGGTTLYRRDMFLEAGGYNERLWTAEEYDLHLRLMKKGYKHRHVKGIVYRYRIHESNKSMQANRVARRKYIKQIQMKYV